MQLGLILISMVVVLILDKYVCLMIGYHPMHYWIIKGRIENSLGLRVVIVLIRLYLIEFS
jgi:hypothetical protein